MSRQVELLWAYDRWGNQIGCIYDWADAYHIDEVNGEDSVTLVLPSIAMQSGDELIKGDRILWLDEFSTWHEHIVNKIETFHLEGTLYYQVYAENSMVELMLDYKDERDSYGFKNAVALQRLLEGTRWSVGQVDDLGVGNVKYYHQSAYEGLVEIVEIWGGEVSSTIAVGPGGVSARYINHRSQIGSDNGLLFEYGYDMDGITRIVDLDEVYTRIYCYGKGEEVYNEETGSVGNGRRIDFAEINGGKKYVEDSKAVLSWGHPDAYGGIQHSVGVFVWEDCEDPAELLALGRAKLDEVKEPRVYYEATVVALADAGFDFKNARAGDTVHILDERLEWRLEGRVLKTVRYFSRNQATEFGMGNTVRNAADVLREQASSLSDLRSRSASWDGAANANFQWLENLIGSLNDQFRAGGSYKFDSFEMGTIYSNVPLDRTGRPMELPASAIQLTGVGFRIANSLTSTGDWNWRTFGTGDGFTADVINTGLLQCGENKIDLVSGIVSFVDGMIEDRNGKFFLNMSTGEMRISTDAQYLDGTIQDYFDGIENEINDVDKALGDLDTELRHVIDDGIVTEAEAAAIAKLLQRVQTEQREAISAYNSVYGNSLLNGTSQKTTLLNAKNALYGTDGSGGAYGTLVTRINQVIACTTAEQVKSAMDNYNIAYAAYQSQRDNFAAALRAAEVVIGNLYVDNAVSDLTDYVEKEFGDVDDAMDDLDKALTQAIEDRSVSEAEAAAIAKMLQRLQAEQAESVSAYTLIYASSYLKGDPKTALKSAKDALYGTNNTSGAYGTLVAAINKVIACTTAAKVDEAMKAYNTAYAAYQTARNDFAKALTVAESSISDNYTDTVVTTAIADVNNQISDVDRAVEDLDTTLTKAIEDKSITEAESAAISKMLQRLNAEEAEAISAYTLLYNNSYLKDTTEKTALNTAYTALYGTKGSLATLKTAINKVLACKTAEAVETAMEAYNEAYVDYQAKREAFANAVRNAEVKVGNAYSDHAVDDFKQSVNKEFEDVREEIENTDAAIRDYVSDEVITEAESAAISKMLQRIQSEQAEAISAYNLVYANANLTGTPKTELNSKKEALYGDAKADGKGGAYGALVTAINAVKNAKTAEAVKKAMEAYDTAYTAYQTARTAFDDALRKAEQNISDNVAAAKAKSAVDAQTQQDIFNKLTNGGVSEGIYLDGTHLYVNATYIKTGTISADRVRTGKIVDQKGKNSWDLDSGDFTTDGMVSSNAASAGVFKTGSTSGFNSTMSKSAFIGYSSNTEIGAIDFSLNQTISGVSGYTNGTEVFGKDFIKFAAPRTLIATSKTAQPTLCPSSAQTYVVTSVMMTGTGSLMTDTAHITFARGFLTGLTT